MSKKNTSTSKQFSAFEYASNSIQGLGDAVLALNESVGITRAKSKDNAIDVGSIAQVVDSMAILVQQLVTASDVLDGFSENPSKFRKNQEAGIDSVWAVKRNLENQISQAAAAAKEMQESLANCLSDRKAHITNEVREIGERLASAEKRAASAERWLHFFANTGGRSTGRCRVVDSDPFAAVLAKIEEATESLVCGDKDVAHKREIIIKSQLFDSPYYQSQLEEEISDRDQLIDHYIKFGWRKGLNPNPVFSTPYYLSQLIAAGKQVCEPLGHYIQCPIDEIPDVHPLLPSKRADSKSGNEEITPLAAFLSGQDAKNLSPLFDIEYYKRVSGLGQNVSIQTALLHYLIYGWKAGLSFSPLFSPSFYRAHFESPITNIEPYTHYMTVGLENGCNPNPCFSIEYYRDQRPNLTPKYKDPMVDYIMEGESLGLAPSALFDPQFYRKSYCQEEQGKSALFHYLDVGQFADHWPRADFDAYAYRKVFYLENDGAKKFGALEHFSTRAESVPISSLDISKLLDQYERYDNEAAETKFLAAGVVSSSPKSESMSAGKAVSWADLKYLRDLLAYREYPGKSKAVAGRPNVLLVAHAAGEFLFGSERSFLDMLAGLSAIPANVYVALPRNVPAYTNAIRPYCVHVETFKYDWWRANTEQSESVIKLFSGVIERHQINVVHCNTIMLRECLSAAKVCGVQSVVHVRELITQDAALLNLIGESPEAIISKTVDSADWVIGNSEITASTFQKKGCTFTIRNTIDLTKFEEVPATSGEVVTFGLISSNIPKKGVNDVIKLAAAAWDAGLAAEFHLIGPETDLIQKIAEEQRTGIVPPNVRFPGYATDPAAAIGSLDVVLNFSHFAESFGRTVLEAMAAGRPVIAYEWGALPELIDHADNGFMVPYLEPEAALKYVRAFCEDRKLVGRMGSSGRAKAQSRYGMDSYKEQFKSAYKQILTASVEEISPKIFPARLEGIKKVDDQPRIAYFCWHFPVPSETFVLNEIEELVKQGYDVIVFCRQSPYKEFSPSFPIAYERVDSSATLARRLTETGRTIVHAHFVYPTVTDMVWPACESAKIPFTFIAHAQDIFKVDNQSKNRLAEIGASQWCRKLFTLSRFHFDFVAKTGFPKDKICINPNAVNTEKFAKASIDGRERRPFRRIVSIHRYVPKKGLDLLIKAAALLKDLNISIELYGYGPCESEYKELVSQLELSNVKIGPQVSQAEIVELMKSADLFVCPSVRTPDGDMDGIPTSIVESMAAGIPVLATAVAGIPDLVVDGLTGMLAQADPQSIASAIRRFYSMPDAKVSAIIKAARVRATTNHDVKRLTRVLTRVWENRAVDVIIVSWNNLPELRHVVSRVIENTATPYHLIICDNQSQREPVREYLQEVWCNHDRVTVVFNNVNGMVGPGTNLALEQGNGDVAIYLCGKEGFSFANGWEMPFVHAFDADNEAGLVGTIGRSPTYLTGAQYPEGIALFPKFRNRQFAQENANRIFGHIQGGLFGIRRSMVEKIGGFSDDVPHDYTDVEYSYYVESCGWKLVEAPGVLALFNKSRPTLSQRFDENVLVAHPVLLPQFETFDKVRAGELFHCNICDWFGESFEGADMRCPGCSSTGRDRSLFRWLAESPYMYRRLPAIALGLGVGMKKVWSEQFQGPNLTSSDFWATMDAKQRLANGSGALHLGLVRISSGNEERFSVMAAELARLLRVGAMALFQLEDDALDWSQFRELLKVALLKNGFIEGEEHTYSSAALQFDFNPILSFQKV